MCKKTPLYDMHCSLNGKMVPFAGYMLPIQYPTGIIEEHNAVRTKCGLFDVSHMGEIILEGEDALANLQYLLVNDMSNMDIGRARYSPMCNEQGGVVDDLLVCKMADQSYLLVVNASNKDKDVAWIQAHLQGQVRMEDISDEVAQFALQGPRSLDILLRLMNEQDIPTKNYTFIDQVKVGGYTCLVSRTGYTGELGFEIYCKPQDAPSIMQLLLDTGREDGLIPCGLGARDTLRLEASMPLYGHEMNDTITPFEANLAFFVKMDKADFIGKQALLSVTEPPSIRVGLEVTGRGIVRENVPLYIGDEQIGTTTSGTFCPHLGKALAMALVDRRYAAVDTQITAMVRGKPIELKVVPLPFYKRKN